MSTTTHFLSPFLYQPLKTPKTLTLIFTKIPQSHNPQIKPQIINAENKPARKNPRKRSFGRKSVLKKSFTQEQVVFTAPLSDDPEVGIIGGGMAGLICALYLEKRGIRSTVFDTGMHGLGGRMGTRIIEPQHFAFDHAAQFFTVSDLRFAELVNGWIDKGIVQQWRGTVGEVEPGGQFSPLPASPPRYIGVNGMRPLADSILSETKLVEVVRPCWISTLEPFSGMWHLSENGKPRGKFDTIVVAHNGKCANRLLASSGLPLIAKQMKRLELSSIWALLAAFEDPLPLTFPFEGAFVKGIDALSWMANNSAKLSSTQGGPHCWTFFSTAAFGKRNKVPQENIPNVTAEKVTMLMLEGVESALGLSKGSLKKPIYTKVQLWGAALPNNIPGTPCIFDPQGRAGICGDWLLGSSLESAALSGMSMASHIADYFQSGGTHAEDYAIGLHNEFQQIEGYDIGQFPGTEPKEMVREELVQI
ncbi:hypothetical protein BVRB_4g083930 isoform A [Beta vulgaris subsp. vulgaris]|nr:hypothetical protein BVRB_4g083930 isoform A [Beta vulgaris subsp. vulgaris]